MPSSTHSHSQLHSKSKLYIFCYNQRFGFRHVDGRHGGAVNGTASVRIRSQVRTHLDRFTSDYPISLKTLKKETHTNQFPQLIENKYVLLLVRSLAVFFFFFFSLWSSFVCVPALSVLCATTWTTFILRWIRCAVSVARLFCFDAVIIRPPRALIRGRNEMHTIIIWIWILQQNETVQYIRLRFAATDRKWTDTPITLVYESDDGLNNTINERTYEMTVVRWHRPIYFRPFFPHFFFLSAFRSIFAAVLLCEIHFLHIFLLS